MKTELATYQEKNEVSAIINAAVAKAELYVRKGYLSGLDNAEILPMEKELDEKSNMQILHNTFSKYKPTKVCSLDVIISVGYRVKSIRGTQFRIWANSVLREYLIKGYAISKRMTEQRYEELKQLVSMLSRTVGQMGMPADGNVASLVNMVADYAYALDTLDRYDYQQLEISGTTSGGRFHATYDAAMDMIGTLRRKFGGGTLFGNEKDDSFKSSIGQIYQTFEGVELYPSVEEKAAMLLYLVTKTIRSATATSA